MIALFRDRIVEGPIGQGRSGHVQTQLVCEREVTSCRPIGIACEGGGTDQKKASGSDIIGEWSDFIVANGFSRQTDHDRKPGLAVCQKIAGGDIRVRNDGKGSSVGTLRLLDCLGHEKVMPARIPPVSPSGARAGRSRRDCGGVGGIKKPRQF